MHMMKNGAIAAGNNYDRNIQRNGRGFITKEV
jgi:hypothetical protein